MFDANTYHPNGTDQPDKYYPYEYSMDFKPNDTQVRQQLLMGYTLSTNISYNKETQDI